MTDWSDHILLSFGDSFTFGDGLLPYPTAIFEHYQAEHEIYGWKAKNLTYTKKLSEAMKFKGHVNFGIPGGSNQHSVRMLVEFLQQNPDLDRSKIFVLFGVTNIYRETISYTNKNNAILYRPFTAPHLAERLHLLSKEIKTQEESLNVVTTLYHDMRMVYEYTSALRTLKEILQTQKIKYFIFDLINEFDYSSIANDPDYTNIIFPEFYISEKEQIEKYNLNFDFNIINNAKDILSGGGFKHRLNLRDLTTNHLPYKMFDGTVYDDPNMPLPHLVRYMHLWAVQKFGHSSSGDPYLERFISRLDNAHWNESGHMIATEIIKSWIEQQDYSYLEL